MSLDGTFTSERRMTVDMYMMSVMYMTIDSSRTWLLPVLACLACSLTAFCPTWQCYQWLITQATLNIELKPPKR